jgi:hypothetical protein
VRGIRNVVRSSSVDGVVKVLKGHVLQDKPQHTGVQSRKFVLKYRSPTFFIFNTIKNKAKRINNIH